VNNTTTPATWFGAQLFRVTTGTEEAINWFTGGDPETCLGRCAGVACALTSDCGAGLVCSSTLNVCVPRACNPGAAVACWNHRAANNEALGACR
jgi:hypothetical protein